MKPFLAAALLCVSLTAGAQAQDPVVMTICGEPVRLSEFDYSFNKNNAEGVIDKKSRAEYVDLFINYKLKVRAALDAHLDTAAAFRKEFAQYRDMQIRPSVITDADVEAEARRIYEETRARIDSTGGMVKVRHILTLVSQRAAEAQQAAAKARIDSLYALLKGGADFADLATRFSDDKATAAQGGALPWLQRKATVKEFDNAAFTMQDGELSQPIRSDFGWHIILREAHQNFFPYDSLRADIMRFIDGRNIREKIINRKLDSIAAAATPALTRDDVLAARRDSMTAADPALRYLIQEYHDGLLLFEISKAEVWQRAEQDEAGLAACFKQNRKKYTWDRPRFKGIAFHCKEQADVAAVKATVKGVPFGEWGKRLAEKFNNDSVLRVRVEKGLFAEGRSALVDSAVFHKDTTVRTTRHFPYDGVCGRIIKKPEDYTDVRPLVVQDHQEQLERQWVAALRRKYPVSVDRAALGLD